MSGALGVAALLVVAAITPGPNNLIVMAAAQRGGWSAALRSILAVVLGSLGLLSICLVGLRSVGGVNPMLVDFCTIGGGLYLAWLGLKLAWGPGGAPDQVGGSMRPWRLALFQAANPKAWVLTAVVAAGAASGGWRGIGLTALMMVAITGVCLALWALAGRSLARLLTSQKARRRADRVMGLALVGTALIVSGPAAAALIGPLVLASS